MIRQRRQQLSGAEEAGAESPVVRCDEFGEAGCRRGPFLVGEEVEGKAPCVVRLGLDREPARCDDELGAPCIAGAVGDPPSPFFELASRR